MTQLEIRLSSSFYRVCKFEVLVSLNVSAWVLIKERNHARRILRVNKVNHFVFVACENEMNFKTNQSKWWNFSTLKLFSTRLWRIHSMKKYKTLTYIHTLFTNSNQFRTSRSEWFIVLLLQSWFRVAKDWPHSSGNINFIYVFQKQTIYTVNWK